MKEALKQISNVVERFQRNIEAYHSPAYNGRTMLKEYLALTENVRNLTQQIFGQVS